MCKLLIVSLVGHRNGEFMAYTCHLLAQKTLRIQDPPNIRQPKCLRASQNPGPIFGILRHVKNQVKANEKQMKSKVTSFPLRPFRESLFRGLFVDMSFEPGTGAIHWILDEHTVTQARD